MPHQRPRQLLSLLEKRLKLFPVVGVLGARQTGKSTLLRELLPQRRKIKYVTLDRNETKSLAIRQPTLFLQNLEDPDIHTVCIDEIQKAATLFDTIKAEVDEKKRPGRFAISGSTEFSRKIGVYESLTGRISLLRIFPLNLAEILQVSPRYPLINLQKKQSTAMNKLALKDVKSWQARGGMPGIFAIREQAQRDSLFEGWIETTCTRDLGQFNIPRFNPDLARRIFIECIRLEEPIRTEIARAVGRVPRQIEHYLQAFKALFALYEIEPYQTSVGKPRFFPFDAGIAAFAGASDHRRLQTWFVNECFSQFSYAGVFRPDLFFYESRRGSSIDFVVQSKTANYSVKLTHDEAPDRYLLRSVEAFHDRHKDLPVYLLAPCVETHKLGEQIKILPWFSVAL